MSREAVENLVEQIAAQMLDGTELELVDVEYVKERDWYLRVYIDKEGGIEIEDCQKVSELLENKLDELDPIKESYYLEVSSPGLDRPLKKEHDFIRHQGDLVELHTFAPVNGQKTFIGTLKKLENKMIYLDVEGKEMSFPKDKTSQIKLYLEF